MSKLSKEEKKRLKKLRKEQSNGEVRKIALLNAPSLKNIIKNNIIFIGVLVIVCFGLYYNSLNNEATLVDDIQSFVFNEKIQDLPGTLRSLDLQKTVYALSYHFWGFNPMPLRVVSVFLHTMVTILAFLFLYKLFGRKIAIISSLIFAVHPINTEAVTWISGSPYLYLSFFTFLVFLSYLSYKQTGNNRYIYQALFIYVATMFLVRAPWILVIPFAIVVIDQLIIEQEISLPKLWWMLLFVVPISIYMFTWFGQAYQTRLAVRLENGRRVTMNTQSFTPIIEGYPYTTYLMSSLYVFPYNLSIYYDGMPVTTFLYISMYSISALYLFGIFYFWKKKRMEVVGILILLPVLIAPTYSPVKVTWFLAERYLYTGTVFFSVLVAMFILYLGEKFHNKYLTYGILAIILILFSLKTYIRNDQWQNTETLALATMKSSPLSVRPYNDVGGYYFYKGDVDTAVDWYEKGLKVVPTSGTAINNLGYIYLEQGPLIFWDQHKPESPNKDLAKQMYDNGMNFVQQKAEPRTVSYFLNKALAYDPTSVEYATNLADLYFNLGLHDSAKLLYSYILRLDPSNDYAIKKLAVLSN